MSLLTQPQHNKVNKYNNLVYRENKTLQTENENYIKQQKENQEIVDPKLAIAEQRTEAMFQELVRTFLISTSLRYVMKQKSKIVFILKHEQASNFSTHQHQHLFFNTLWNHKFDIIAAVIFLQTIIFYDINFTQTTVWQVTSERRNIQLVCEKQCLAIDIQRVQDIHTRETKRREWEESLLKNQCEELR